MARGKAESLVAERKTLEGVIHDDLHARIVSLEYPPGHMIFENEIAAEFGVSRTPVRQAFFRLAMEGLLEVLPQRGARVSFLSKAKVRESQEIRTTLECLSVGKAAQRFDANDADCLAFKANVESIIAAQVKAVEARDDASFTRLDEDYHRALMRFSGNMTLHDIVSDLRAHINRIRLVELQEDYYDANAIVYHRQIFDAVCAGDPERASERMRAHLKVLEEFREELFSRRDDVFV